MSSLFDSAANVTAAWASIRTMQGQRSSIEKFGFSRTIFSVSVGICSSSRAGGSSAAGAEADGNTEGAELELLEPLEEAVANGTGSTHSCICVFAGKPLEFHIRCASSASLGNEHEQLLVAQYLPQRRTGL